MVEHDVDNNAGNRNIKPKRKRPACYFSVSDEIASSRSVKSNQNERDYHNG